jgi:hypothetical protein
MLPIYKAVSFQRVLEKGGRTKPWLILVNADGSQKPYVVKLFETSLIQTRDSVTNEVLGNILAKEFQLPVPDAALIDMDDYFIGTLRDFTLIDILDNRDTRLKFGSSLLDGYVRFDGSDLSPGDARKIISIDSVFAFDNLIRNADRNKVKPNILVRSDEAYLIDHELGFEINENTIKELTGWTWSIRYYKYHIFYPHLKSSWQRHKDDYFNEFEECLKLLNINRLLPYLKQLEDAGFDTKNHVPIIDYLTQMKRNCNNFVNLMRGLISI